MLSERQKAGTLISLKPLSELKVLFERCLRTRIALENPLSLRADHTEPLGTLEPHESIKMEEDLARRKVGRINSYLRDSIRDAETPLLLPESAASIKASDLMPGGRGLGNESSFQVKRPPDTVSIVASSQQSPGKQTIEVTAEFSVKQTGVGRPGLKEPDVEITNYSNLFKHKGRLPIVDSLRSYNNSLEYMLRSFRRHSDQRGFEELIYG